MIFSATSDGSLEIGGRRVRCALGRSGVLPAADKREGDGASPLGVWPFRRVLYRPDREPAPGDPAYNRPVRLPYPASAETLWRDDRVYDLIVVLGHNDDPPVSPMGSAIFLHLAQPDGSPTAGCVAVRREDLLDLLSLAGPEDALAILPGGFQP
jgi:L,D-peptidoglycan transpeptidase YkuD (ErfK/YbiS/YcfS/YnhG family)